MFVFYLPEDLAQVLAALDQANDRAKDNMLRFGADPALARLAAEVYAGALADMALAFGLPPSIVTGYQRDALEMEARTVEALSLMDVEER